MRPWAELCWRGVRSLVDGCLSFVLWTVWLALTLLLALQLYVLSANELAMPEFVLRHFESKLAESGLRATFKRTLFDPAGQLHFEDVRLSPRSFDEPVVTARSVYIKLNLWWLAMGQVEPREIRVTDVALSVPAILSPTGRPAPIVTGLDATFEPDRRSVHVRQLSARVGNAVLTAHGQLMIAPTVGTQPASNAVRELITERFADTCRQALAATSRLESLEDPAVHLEFSPSEGGAATIDVQALARTVRWPGPPAAEATAVVARTRFLLFGEAPPSDLEVSAAEIRVPGTVTGRGVQARVLGRIRLDGGGFDLRELALTADAVDTADVGNGGVGSLAVRLFPRGWPRLEASAVLRLLGAPLAVQGDVDVGARQARVSFAGDISPRVLDVVSARVKTDVRRFYSFESLTAERGDVRFGEGWKFESLTARVRVPRMNSFGVIMEDGRTTVELTPRRFHSPDAFARVGEYFARGSYDHDLTTHEYRFLLDGRLRPLEIARWFRPWWSGFFAQLEFPVAAPDASVDVQGSWRDPRQSRVFVFADVTRPIVRGTELDRARTRLFIRPGFFDGLELLLARDQGNARGRFTYVIEPVANTWQTVDLAFDSTLDLALVAELVGPIGTRIFAPFQVTGAPNVTIAGRFSSPAAEGGANVQLRIDASTQGLFRFQQFPLQDVSFLATLNRDEILLEKFAGRFAGGALSGKARVWGIDAQRRLGFDFTLDDASLGQVAAEIGGFFAARRGEPDAPPDKFVQEKANVRLALAASAEGRYDDPMSYRGTGHALLAGAGLGEVPLLGTLSELLRFTSLRFTEARTNFRLEGPKVVFPEVTLRGANAAVDAHGSYGFDTRTLDFNAKLFPFQDSDNLLKTVVGAFLSPLSNAFEVKLVGTLAKPEWSFVMGPTNLLRSLAPGAEATPKPPEPTPTDKAPVAEPEPALRLPLPARP
ncbi:MAG: hypothetical protein JNL92_21960 [Opitutaceae bacterium]|nr:hypothetical protein [Opitutaceae bacterium]